MAFSGVCLSRRVDRDDMSQGQYLSYATVDFNRIAFVRVPGSVVADSEGEFAEIASARRGAQLAFVCNLACRSHGLRSRGYRLGANSFPAPSLR